MMDASRCPCTPQWNLDRPFLTGNFHQEEKSTSVLPESKGNSVDICLESEKPIGCYNASLQVSINLSILLLISHFLGVIHRIWHIHKDDLPQRPIHEASIDELMKYVSFFFYKTTNSNTL
ncbi:hypothetical protein Hanom_Chr14g01260381 [Helianthus anomalus]